MSKSYRLDPFVLFYTCIIIAILLIVLPIFFLTVRTNPRRKTTTSSGQRFELSKNEAALLENGSYFSSDIFSMTQFLDGFNGIQNLSHEEFKIFSVNITKVGILIPSTTRKIKKKSLTKLTLIRDCIPSILRTVTKGFFYKIFIGIDADDMYLSKLRSNLQRMSNFSMRSIELVETKGGNFVSTVNTLALEAVTQGMDYLTRINDDTVFTSGNWTPTAILQLKSNDPPDIGVVGPTCKEGKTHILTHDFVHKTHFEIFGFYYPAEFQNWWADDWITQTYQPSRSRILPGWTVKHLLSESRYTVDPKVVNLLDKCVARDNDKMMFYMFNLKHFKVRR